jgi:pimeloyl-ACP methyl ester carboxylesterase
MKVWVLFIAIVLLSGNATAQDYEREKRWAAEVVPNLVVGEVVQLKLPSGREFLGIHVENRAAKNAILLVHGLGVHPDHGVIGILRASLADLGYATLSIQMPVQKPDAATDEYFPGLFPEAAARIQAGADWLAQNGYPRPVLLSHSMGSWMSNVYFERTSGAPFAAWVCMGRSGAFGRMGSAQMPVLDLYGEKDLPGVLRADWRRRLMLDGIPGSKQVRIPAADHHYTGLEKELAAEIVAFLAQLK